tara:strand:+ start:102 stop:893 length:792 start_codon:yes stop_codon:yes gene_type:complete
MKIALCLHGLVGSTNSLSYLRNEGDDDGKRLCAELSFNDWKRCVIDPNDVDVFFHTWDEELEEYLVESYKPKKYQIEKQIIFNVEHKDDTPRNQACYSRWYGGKRVIEMKSEYEKENNFIYDCVIDARFDLAWNKPYDFSKLDMDYFYVPIVEKDGVAYGWPHTGQQEVMDWVFFSNSKNMNDFSPLLYDNLGEYNRTIHQWKGMSPHFQSFAHLVNLNLLPDKCKVGINLATPNRNVNEAKMTDNDHCQLIRRQYFGETLRG